MFLQLNKAFDLDLDRSEPCTVQIDNIALLCSRPVGRHSQGCEITLKCGEQFKVWESYAEVNKALLHSGSEVVGVKA